VLLCCLFSPRPDRRDRASLKAGSACKPRGFFFRAFSVRTQKRWMTGDLDVPGPRGFSQKAVYDQFFWLNGAAGQARPCSPERGHAQCFRGFVLPGGGGRGGGGRGGGERFFSNCLPVIFPVWAGGAPRAPEQVKGAERKRGHCQGAQPSSRNDRRTPSTREVLGRG